MANKIQFTENNKILFTANDKIAFDPNCCCSCEEGTDCDQCPSNCGPPCFYVEIDFYDGYGWERFRGVLHYCPGGVVPSTPCLEECCWRGKWYESSEGTWIVVHLFHDGTKWKIEYYTGMGYDIWINCQTHYINDFSYPNIDFTCETGGTFYYEWPSPSNAHITFELTVCEDCVNCPP